MAFQFANSWGFDGPGKATMKYSTTSRDTKSCAAAPRTRAHFVAARLVRARRSAMLLALNRPLLGILARDCGRDAMCGAGDDASSADELDT